jgi:hypothetical protein
VAHVRLLLDADDDPPLKGLAADQIIQGEVDTMAVLPGGMVSGKPSVVITAKLPDGRAVLLEISLSMLQMATAAFTVRYGSK